MSRGDGANKLPKLVLAGIDQAFKEYQRLTGGEWLYAAPEYLTTVEVAKKVHSGLDHVRVDLERNVKKALDGARAKRKGRAPGKLRSNGRFDILLYRKNESPWCAIEIKTGVWTAKALKSDIERLEKVLGYRGSGATLRCGAIGFYADRKDGKKLSAEQSLEKLWLNVKELADQCLSGKSLKFKLHRSKFRSGDENDGRQAFCLLIEATKPRK